MPTRTNTTRTRTRRRTSRRTGNQSASSKGAKAPRWSSKSKRPSLTSKALSAFAQRSANRKTTRALPASGWSSTKAAKQTGKKANALVVWNNNWNASTFAANSKQTGSRKTNKKNKTNQRPMAWWSNDWSYAGSSWSAPKTTRAGKKSARWSNNNANTRGAFFSARPVKNFKKQNTGRQGANNRRFANAAKAYRRAA